MTLLEVHPHLHAFLEPLEQRVPMLDVIIGGEGDDERKFVGCGTAAPRG